MYTLSMQQRRIHPLLVLLLIFGLFAPMITRGAGSGTVFMTAPQVHTEIWNANFLTHNTGLKQTDAMLDLVFMTALYQDDPQLSPQAAQRQLVEFRTRYQQERQALPYGYDDAQKALLYTQLGVKVLGEVVPGGYGKAAKVLDPILNQIGAPLLEELMNTDATERAVQGMQETYFQAQQLWSVEVMQGVFGQVHGVAAQNPFYKQAIDGTFGPHINASLGDDPGDILARNPLLQGLQEIKEIQGMIESGTGAIRTDLDTLKKLVGGLTADMAKRYEAQNNALMAIAAQQGDLLIYAKRADLRAQAEDLARKEAKKTQEVMDGVRGGISILSTLIGLENPKLGKQVAVVANTAIQVGMAAAKLAVGFATMNPFALLSSASDILGGIMNVIGVFGETGPTADELILEGLQKIGEQIQALQERMDTRFDRIEHGLSKIFDTMTEQFDRINWKLEITRQQLTDIRSQLINATRNLDLLHSQMLVWLQDLGQRDLKDAMDAALGYQERTNEPMDYARYVALESKLYVWATQKASDEVEAPTSARGVLDKDLFAELQRDANLNYLARVLRERRDLFEGIQLFTTERVPNVATWALAAYAYSQFESEWPQHAARISPSRHQAVAAIGERLRRAIRNIAVVDTPQGQQGNTLLFNRLLDNYAGKYEGLRKILSDKETWHVNNWRKDHGYPQELDPFGGVTQLAPFYDPLPEISRYCDGRPFAHPFQSPDNATRMAPPQYRLAKIFNLQRPALDFCVVSSTQVPSMQSLSQPMAPIDPILPCDSAIWELTLAMRNNGPSIVRTTLTVTIPPVAEKSVACALNYSVGRARMTSALRASAFSIEDEPWNVLASTLTGAVEQKLRSGLTAIYTGIAKDLESGDLHDAAIVLSGAKALLGKFARYGLPVALGTDEVFNSLIGGDQSIHDLELLRDTYARAAIQPNPASNARNTIDDANNTRVTELRAKIQDHLVQAAAAPAQLSTIQDVSAETSKEGHTLIDFILLRLEWAEVVARGGSQPNENIIQVYLPLIVKQQ